MLVTSSQMKAAEAAAFARGIDPGDWMDLAGAGMARAIRNFFPEPGHAILSIGKGHNAGDVLAAGRHLASLGWSHEIEFALPESELAPLTARHLAALRPLSRPRAPGAIVLLDGLLGVGASGPPREPLARAIRRINERRAHGGVFVVAADLPSGLDADSGQPADPCVIADLTVTLGHPKVGLLADAALGAVGRLALVPFPGLQAEGDMAELITPTLLRPLLPPRPFDSHKGTWGRVGIIAGSPGTLGAARLCAEGALRAGAGLVTLYAEPSSYEQLAVITPPEIMVRPVSSYAAALEDRLDAIAIGPGLGSTADTAVRDLVVKFPGPMVVDADALNLLARNPDDWRKMAGPRLFTPHPGEMARLFPESRTLSRRATAEQFAARHFVAVLLKGARTVIAEVGAPTAFNATGNPGMGSGGMGDVLSGVTATFLAQGRTPRQAAMLGAWICGRAAELYVFGPTGSPESLVAGEIIHRLGQTIQEIRTGAVI